MECLVFAFCTASPHQYATIELNMTKFTTAVHFYYIACCGVCVVIHDSVVQLLLLYNLSWNSIF